MKRIFSFLLVVLLASVCLSARTAYSQLLLSNDLTVPKSCLEKESLIPDAVDWQLLMKKDRPEQFPFHKANYLNLDWIIGFMVTEGGTPILVGWPTNDGILPYTKVFGVLLKQERKAKPKQRYVSLTYQSIASTCVEERKKVVGLLVKDGRFGKSESMYEW